MLGWSWKRASRQIQSLLLGGLLLAVPLLAIGGCGADDGSSSSVNTEFSVVARTLGPRADRDDDQDERSQEMIDEIIERNQSFLDRGNAAEIEEKYENMAGSPFVFYRGTAHLFWWDAKKGRPGNRSAYLGGMPGNVWLAGDQHMSNFGTVEDNDGVVSYEFNDFDESFFGPYIWDLRRLVTSIYLASEEQGLTIEDADLAAEACVGNFLMGLEQFANTDDELTVRWTLDHAYGEVEDIIEKAERASQGKLLKKYTDLAGQFTNAKGKLEPVTQDEWNVIAAQLPAYIAQIPEDVREDDAFYAIKDIARRVHSGIGSLGSNRFYILIEAEDANHDNDRILDVKESFPSSIRPNQWRAHAPPGLANRHGHNGLPNLRQPKPARGNGNGRDPGLGHGNGRPKTSLWASEAERVVRVAKRAWTNTTKFIATMELDGNSFRVLEKQTKDKDIDLEDDVGANATKMVEVAEQMGWLTARFFARMDQDLDPESVPFDADAAAWAAVASDTAGFIEETVSFGRNYAALVTADYATFLEVLETEGPLLGASPDED